MGEYLSQYDRLAMCQIIVRVAERMKSRHVPYDLVV